MPSCRSITRELQALGNPDIAEHSGRFFKSAPGEYGAGDRFIGIRVPVIRQQLKKHWQQMDLKLAIELLHSDWHEIRLFAVLALLDLYNRAATDAARKKVVQQYLKHRRYVNNWDIVDASAPGITGAWFYDRDRSRIRKMVSAKSLWDRRIAVLSTFYFIRQHDFDDTYLFAEQLLADQEDLLHKACGWMLREAGKRDSTLLHDFLDRYAATMPRTMLRYAIEKLPDTLRKRYMAA